LLARAERQQRAPHVRQPLNRHTQLLSGSLIAAQRHGRDDWWLLCSLELKLFRAVLVALAPVHIAPTACCN
jgi:hypothetical protein